MENVGVQGNNDLRKFYPIVIFHFLHPKHVRFGINSETFRNLKMEQAQTNLNQIEFTK